MSNKEVSSSEVMSEQEIRDYIDKKHGNLAKDRPHGWADALTTHDKAIVTLLSIIDSLRTQLAAKDGEIADLKQLYKAEIKIAQDLKQDLAAAREAIQNLRQEGYNHD
jgi:chromosome segregation ATPase